MDNLDEDAVRTEQSIRYICSHSYVALEPFQPAPKDVDTPLKAEIGSSQTAGDFQPLTPSISVGKAGKYPICKYCQEQGKVALLNRKRSLTAKPVCNELFFKTKLWVCCQ